jgi:hypothetical protein
MLKAHQGRPASEVWEELTRCLRTLEEPLRASLLGSMGPTGELLAAVEAVRLLQAWSGAPSAPSAAPMPVAEAGWEASAAHGVAAWQRILRVRRFTQRTPQPPCGLDQQLEHEPLAVRAETAALQLRLARSARRQRNLALASRMLREASAACASGAASAELEEALRLETAMLQHAAGHAVGAARALWALALPCLTGAHTRPCGQARQCTNAILRM